MTDRTYQRLAAAILIRAYYDARSIAHGALPCSEWVGGDETYRDRLDLRQRELVGFAGSAWCATLCECASVEPEAVRVRLMGMICQRRTSGAGS